MRLLFLLLFSISVNASDKFQTFCLTQNIYHEARGEMEAGKIAVGYVTLNRLQHPDFPKTICEVVYETCQFSWSCTSTKPIDLEEWKISEEVAKNVLLGKYQNLVKDSYYYYNPRKANPFWKKTFCKRTIRIDQHNFCTS